MRKKVTLGLLLAFALFSISATSKKPKAISDTNLFQGIDNHAITNIQKQDKQLSMNVTTSRPYNK